MRGKLYTGAIYLFLVALEANVALAQNVTGSIVGIVRDATGAVVAAAAVTVTNEGTNQELKLATTRDGEYVAPNLAPGSYGVKVESAGFQATLVKGVVLLANRSARIDVTLSPSQLSQTVEVAAEAPVVNSENATIGNIIDSRTIVTVPLNGRTLDRLVRISAGVTSDSASNPRVAGSAYWGGIQFNVDGGTYNDLGNGGAAYSYSDGLTPFPSVDSIAEFKMDSNSMNAEFEGATTVTVVGRSGTNQFHGSAFEFNRNRADAAKNFFATGLPNPEFNRNEFGATFGGPVFKNKTFFFMDYEGLRERTARTNLLSVPTVAMRNGNFAGFPAMLDSLAGTPFPNNQIPSTRLDPRSQTLLGYVPTPNLPGTGPMGSLNDYVANVGSAHDVNRAGIRLDHHFSEKDVLWVGYNYSFGEPYSVAQNYPATYGQWSDGGYETASASISETHTFSPTTLNDIRFGWFDHASKRLGVNTNFNPQTLFPTLFGPLPVGGLPEINIAGYTSIGDYGGAARGKQYTMQYTDNFTHVMGKHTLKAGIDFANYRNSTPPAVDGLLTSTAQEAGFGRFDFSGRYSNSNPAASATPANSLADFILGYPAFTYRATPSPISLYYDSRYSAYVQDSWQATSRVTVSFGVRYLAQTSWKERNNAMANFNFNLDELVIPGGSLPPQSQPLLVSAYPIVTAKQAGITSSAIDSDRLDLEPRMGIAFRPFGDNKTVIRAGAGVYYDTLPLFIGFRQLTSTNPPFLLTETFEAASTPTPSLTLANPFPGQGAIAANPTIYAVQHNIQQARSQQWNFTLEREIARNLGVRASYVGNHTSHLPWYGESINLPAVQQPGQLQPERPHQPWADIDYTNSGADSTLNQLQLEAIQRFSRGLTFQAEYAWNRSIDDVPTTGGPQNPYNDRADRGNSDLIRRHVFTFTFNYELPFGAGKGWLNTGVASKIFGGWQLAGIWYAATGTPFSVTYTATLPPAISSRANLIGDPNGPRTIKEWFNPAAFAAPAPYTFGDGGRNILFGPGAVILDTSLLREVKIRERFTVQFRAEAFNLPNRANFSNPAANISSPSTVGTITSASDPRELQFALKLLF